MYFVIREKKKIKPKEYIFEQYKDHDVRQTLKDAGYLGGYLLAELAMGRFTVKEVRG